MMKIKLPTPERWALLENFNLGHGGHSPKVVEGQLSGSACAMELFSYVFDLGWTDNPECVDPHLTAMMIGLNDLAKDCFEESFYGGWSKSAQDLRNRLRPFLVKLLNTRYLPFEICQKFNLAHMETLEVMITFVLGEDIYTTRCRQWEERFEILKKAIDLIPQIQSVQPDDGVSVDQLNPEFIYRWDETYLSSKSSNVVLLKDRLYFVDASGKKAGLVDMDQVNPAHRFHLVKPYTAHLPKIEPEKISEPVLQNVMA